MDSFLDTRIGVVVHCEGGTLRIPDYSRAIAYDDKSVEVRRFEGVTDHFANFIEAVRSRKVEDLHADIREGHVSSALCHLGNISHLMGGACSKKEIEAAVARHRDAAEACARLTAHLEANEVDLEQTKLRLGSWLAIDAATERCRDAAANRLATREYRAGFVVPAEV
jgi:hypothetical protein